MTGPATEQVPDHSPRVNPRVVLVLNGANLNLLGRREPQVYGASTLDDVEDLCRAQGEQLGVQVEFSQTNHEGELLEWVHEGGRRHAAGEVVGAVINPGAWTHTSIALRDAIAGSGLPVVECHISNVHAREEFRHHSHVSAVAHGVVVGFGVLGYPLAIAGLVRVVDNAAASDEDAADEDAVSGQGSGEDR